MAKTSSAKLNMMMGEAPWQLDLKKVIERCDYLLSTGIWSDCTFVVGSEIDEEVHYGHKLILAMASPVFEAMFYGKLSERHEIHIPDIQPEAFRALLAYIYTGEVQICSFNLAWDLWYAGKKYQLPHLVGLCKTYIQSLIAPKNACKAYEMARFFEDQSLMDLCIQTIIKNTKVAINDSSFDDIQLNTVVTVCTLDPLNVDSELDLFHAVARYAKAQERKQEQKISPDEGRPKDDLPSKNLSISKESQTQGEKVVNGEIESCAQNKPVAVQLDTKSDDTEEQFDPKQNKETQEGAQGIRVHKRSLEDVKCYENGKFYRDPDRPDLSIWTAEECAKYYLCLDGEVFEFRCSPGLLFDVNRQLCDKPQNVHNCELTTETIIPRPLLDMADCANDTHIGCSDGSCIPAEYFCDGSNDCDDASDEGWCDINYDPNAAEPCDPILCQLPNCYCSNGTLTPRNLVPTQTPQMITLTFAGAVNHENWDVYTKHIFTPNRVNPNGCSVKATFFVSHPYTNYRHVQKLWNDGHEIAINSITHRGPEDWWSKNATVEDWFDEMVGEANIINRFGRVRMEDIRGMRVPYLSVGWNRQYLMMQEFGFVYDATVVAPVADPPFWPYTLDYRMPHKCTGNNQYCPSRSYAGIWEMVINPLVKEGHTCATLEYCPSTLSGDDVYDILMTNFKRHYLKNRAPFGIHLSSTWLRNNEYLIAFKQFMTDLQKLQDVYFVTYKQVLDWIKRPTPVLQIKNFQPWMCKHRRHLQEAEVACTKPNTCKLPSRVLEHDKYMITCMDCPKTYPWLRNEFGFE